MFNILEETLFREYFLHNAVLGAHTPTRKLFAYFAKLFGVVSRRADVLFQLTEQEAVKEIMTESDVNRYKRIAQYQHELGKPNLYDDQTDALIAVKSDAISAAVQSKLCLESKATANKVQQALLDAANCGCIVAMRILGVLRLNGLFVKKDCDKGRDLLFKASQWGDVISMFCLVREGQRDVNLLRNFVAATQNTTYSFLYTAVEDLCQQVEDVGDAEVLLLNKLFNQQLINRNVYSPAHAHVLYATALSREDKERILLSENKHALPALMNLPIYCPMEELSCNVDAIRFMRLRREGEQNKIVTALQNRDLRTTSQYKPLCLVVDSPYLQKIYAKAIESCFNEENVTRIYVDELQPVDFEQSANNVFVRNCKCVGETEGPLWRKNGANNVFLLFINGDVNETVWKHVVDFLLTVRRRQTRLTNPAITLNLSYVLPICICNADNARQLKSLVETVQIADVNSQERGLVVDSIVRKKAYFYFGKEVEITDSALLNTSDLTLESVEEIVDTAFRTLRAQYKDKEEIALQIQPFVKQFQQSSNQRGYGFGGFNQ